MVKKTAFDFFASESLFQTQQTLHKSGCQQITGFNLVIGIDFKLTFKNLPAAAVAGLKDG